MIVCDHCKKEIQGPSHPKKVEITAGDLDAELAIVHCCAGCLNILVQMVSSALKKFREGPEMYASLRDTEITS